jgi:hypothetical protein
MTLITLPDTYGYVMLVTVCIGLELIIIGFVIPQGARKKVFTK